MNKLLLGLFLLAGSVSAGLADEIVQAVGSSGNAIVDAAVEQAAHNAEHHGFGHIKGPKNKREDYVTFDKVYQIIADCLVSTRATLEKHLESHQAKEAMQATEKILKDFEKRLKEEVQRRKRGHSVFLRRKK